MRISIKNTRSMITAILDGSIEKSEFCIEPIFGLNCPVSLEEVGSEVFNQRLAWDNPDEYDKHAIKLVQLFIDNFKIFGDAVSYLEHAGPQKQNKIII